ncbi:MAG: YwmB family TATA-box binding protein [Clostridiaceae bacterium]|nr:YwmB family TATA-box binding protein [Clostridiaceae bacterium]
MARLKKTYIFLLILIFSLFIYGDKCKATKNIDIFNELLEITNGEIVEIGLKVEYKTNNDGETECRKLLSNLNLDLASKVVVNNEQDFCVKFTKENFSGYIESMLSEGDERMVINVIKKTKENDLKDMEKEIRLAVEDKAVKMKLYKYVKGKLEDHDLTSINDKLLKEIKAEGACNVDSLRISNGYSIVANTNRFNPEISGGKLIDLNCILCNYSSGNYILIGTPEIIASY